MVKSSVSCNDSGLLQGSTEKRQLKRRSRLVKNLIKVTSNRNRQDLEVRLP